MADSTRQLAMPSRPDMVREAVARLDTKGLRSQLLQLDTPTLHDLGLRLTDRQVTVVQAHQWLNKELGAPTPGGSDAEIIDDNAVYRFAQHFRRLYSQVRAEHARRLVKLTVDDATAGNVDLTAQVAKASLIGLVTEKVLDLDDIEDINARHLTAMLETLSAHSKGRLQEAQLALKVEESKRKAQKLESDLAKAQADMALKQQRIDQMRSKFEQEIKARQSKAHDGKLSETDLSQVRRAVFGDAA